jgi:hypothetical protein|nr:MAG TPA: hypothetical protein [Caudoviricetes sp.]
MDNLLSLILSVVGTVFGGTGLWAYLKTRAETRKTPYDLFVQMIDEQTKFYAEKNAEYARERQDSAEKSHVIAQASRCQHRFRDASIHCAVEEANDERLKRKCEICRAKEEVKE